MSSQQLAAGAPGGGQLDVVLDCRGASSLALASNLRRMQAAVAALHRHYPVRSCLPACLPARLLFWLCGAARP